ncbi:MAG: 50S ribosomal protein L25 [Negativicutes bacterium]|nr:50S ribosomal protein L25 [Negativicutes bacterium]
MERPILHAEIRKELGKNHIKAVRKAGRIPAVVYGAEVANGSMGVSLDNAEFDKAITKYSAHSLFDLEINGEKKTVYVTEIQKHPVHRRYVHVDLHQMEMNVVQSFRMPISFVGSPVGVKNGGIFEIQIHQIEISCLPAALPDRVEVDISNLGINEVVYAKDIVLPADVTLDIDGMMVLAIVSSLAEEAAVTESETPAEPEMIKEKKTEEKKPE